MKVDATRFKEHVLTMRRDREMEIDRVNEQIEEQMRKEPTTAMDSIATRMIIEREISFLNQLADGIDNSMEPDHFSGK